MKNITPNNTTVQDALSRATATIKRSEEAVEKSNQLLVQLKTELKKIDEDNQRAQDAVDKDIVRIVQDMDEETANFVLATEE